MANVYLPGSRRDAGKLYSPLASLTTVTVMVAPLFLALTRTPSIGPSGSERTLPVRAGLGSCVQAGCTTAGDASRAIAIPSPANALMRRSHGMRWVCLSTAPADHGAGLKGSGRSVRHGSVWVAAVLGRLGCDASKARASFAG